MRRLIFPCAIAALFLATSISYAGFDLLKKIQDTVEDKIDETVDKSLEDGSGDTAKGTKGDGEDDGGSKSDTSTKSSKIKDGQDGSPPETSAQDLKAWSKYDFVPGDLIIFHDDLQGEENGEFPSRWDLDRGNVEIAVYGEEKVINFATTQQSGIVPLMTKEGDYLPEKFTIEFDAYFSEFCTTYRVELYDVINHRPPKYIPVTVVDGNHVGVEGFGGTDLARREYPFWEHIAISFNTRALKVYFGKQRVMNIPNLRAEPLGVTIKSRQCHLGKQAFIKNIRIAEGSKKLYDRIMTDGKFVTSGILFDVNKATIKPISMGVINEIIKMMKEHEDLKLSIQGHTDSDGDKDFNQELSEKRAVAVRDLLVDSDIESSRLNTKGYGETKPVADNSTPEGKANNRRVEFVKM